MCVLGGGGGFGLLVCARARLLVVLANENAELFLEPRRVRHDLSHHSLWLRFWFGVLGYFCTWWGQNEEIVVCII